MALRTFFGIRFLIKSQKFFFYLGLLPDVVHPLFGSLLRFNCSSVLSLVAVTLLVGLCILYAEDSLSYHLWFSFSKSIVIPVSRAIGSDAVWSL